MVGKDSDIRAEGAVSAKVERLKSGVWEPHIILCGGAWEAIQGDGSHCGEGPSVPSERAVGS